MVPVKSGVYTRKKIL